MIIATFRKNCFVCIVPNAKGPCGGKLFTPVQHDENTWHAALNHPTPPAYPDLEPVKKGGANGALPWGPMPGHPVKSLAKGWPIAAQKGGAIALAKQHPGYAAKGSKKAMPNIMALLAFADLQAARS